MRLMLQVTDVAAGALVLLALALKFKHRWVWVLYALACWSYTAINFYKGLPGQATMNLVAGGIAAWNIATWKPHESCNS